MSLASEYAARQAAVETNKVTTNQSAPPAHEGRPCTGSVDTDGNCRLVPGPGLNAIVATPEEAIALANWIVATFA